MPGRQLAASIRPGRLRYWVGESEDVILLRRKGVEKGRRRWRHEDPVFFPHIKRSVFSELKTDQA